jgi:hypothetical protein
MRFEDALAHLPAEPLSPRDKLLAALEMYEEGIATQRLSLERRFPDATAQEIDSELNRWLAREDESP